MSGEVRVSLTLKEVYELLCDDCRRRLRKLVRDKVAESLVEQVIGV